MFWIIENEETVQTALARIFHGSSVSAMRSWLRHDLIRVNTKAVKQLDAILKKGSFLERIQPKKVIGPDLEVVYADEHLIVIDKPVGLLSVATDKGDKQDLFSILKDHLPCEVYVLHRLDRETSGLICFALSQLAYESLKEQLQGHKMRRHYMAIVKGRPDPLDGAWDLWLKERADMTMRPCEPGDGEEALTFYTTLDQGGGLSLLDLQLATGKKHQIRLSCKMAECPIWGDERYGGQKATRVALHAYMLSIEHPATHQMLELYSPNIAQFESYWRACVGKQRRQKDSLSDPKV